MPQKKITDLQLRGSVTDSLNFPSDDTIQSYRVTASQLFDYIWSKIFPSAKDLSNLTIAPSVALNALTVAIKTKAGTDPSSSDPIYVSFRNSTLSNGGFDRRSITAALSVVVSSGSTLGQVSGQASRIWVYLIDNGGTVELAVSHKRYREDELVSTTAEGGAGAADSATAIYSTTARASVPIRLIGYLDNTQAAAGTWATAPSQVQLLPIPNRKAPTITTLTSGSGTYNTPAGCTRLRVRMVGGGAGGSGGNPGGGFGGVGGNTTFGSSLLTATGGVAQTGNVNGPPPAAVSGTVNSPAIGYAINGGRGTHGGTSSSLAGTGASTPFGAGGSGGYAAGTLGFAASANTGAGGGGGGSTGGNNCGAGGNSGAYVEAILNDPDASYAYAVGAGGTAGTSSSASAGGAGGSGIIVIEEYYE